MGLGLGALMVLACREPNPQWKGPVDDADPGQTTAGEDSGSPPATTTGPVSCDPPMTDCDGVCVDLQSDEDHCSGCNMPCSHPENCVEGVCDKPGND
jgi:hypothetical protein